ncbi:MAG: 4Fe-4S binding protein [Clostridiales bacterium]|mgnify:CR=1 FL=1|nr:4Fe-4S binding protein [Clostridiales bacterium]
MKKAAKKNWYDYLYIASAIYLFLGLFNILFAWLGMLCFTIPLIISFKTGTKTYCNKYCGRGQLFNLLGKKLKLSRNKSMPNWMKSKVFRYGFLLFFLTMFSLMIFNTVLVFNGTRSLSQVVTLLWTFKIPWQWAYHITSAPLWVSQYAFGFYSIMLTSIVLGIITMAMYKPRSWCIYCPMGTMTQLVCVAKESANKTK